MFYLVDRKYSVGLPLNWVRPVHRAAPYGLTKYQLSVVTTDASVRAHNVSYRVFRNGEEHTLPFTLHVTDRKRLHHLHESALLYYQDLLSCEFCSPTIVVLADFAFIRRILFALQRAVTNSAGDFKWYVGHSRLSISTVNRVEHDPKVPYVTRDQVQPPNGAYFDTWLSVPYPDVEHAVETAFAETEVDTSHDTSLALGEFPWHMTGRHESVDALDIEFPVSKCTTCSKYSDKCVPDVSAIDI